MEYYGVGHREWSHLISEVLAEVGAKFNTNVQRDALYFTWSRVIEDSLTEALIARELGQTQKYHKYVTEVQNILNHNVLKLNLSKSQKCDLRGIIDKKLGC